ncbi:uncharacterized protein LOC106064298 isoform X2 [Biomphalaria glabrata]|uniref:Uncharacterized protein LOC106064298 isoform X2 n=1 Tax=Biomphalaria glabrata TaxID=6526 RepID=A0A9W3B9B3_BIOGL|nr:uncharacterized protein LOC106064298 isoform X2 [Biomphalaria glabrata]
MVMADNVDEMEQNLFGSPGIEASDLVSLLCRFEEATKPVPELITPVLTIGSETNTRKNDLNSTLNSTLCVNQKENSNTLQTSECETTYLINSNTNKSSTIVNNKSISKFPMLCVQKDLLLGNQPSEGPQYLLAYNSNRLVAQSVHQTHIGMKSKIDSRINSGLEEKTFANSNCFPSEKCHQFLDKGSVDHNYCFAELLSRENKAVVPKPVSLQSPTESFSLVSNTSIENTETTVEEGQVFIDNNGNDLQLESTQPSGHLETADVYKQKQHVKRKRINGNSKRLKLDPSHSCDQEDDSMYFDKIPSFLTALSIPTKSIKTSVFESASTSIGLADHIDFVEKEEPLDEHHFTKVPAHRTCFTNTVKEVNIQESGNCSNENNSCPNEENILRYLNHSPSPLESVERCLLSPARLSRSHTRGSFRSNSLSSDCSSCSTCSSRSYCSTCDNSRSRSRSFSSCSSDSRSRSRSPSSRNSRKRQLSRCRYSPFHDKHGRSRSSVRKERLRSHSPNQATIERRKEKEREREKAMEERRVVYVGKIPNDYTKRQLHQRFQCFGEIKEVKLNFREHGDNYGFVTFAYACDAIAAKERGNSTADPLKFDLCFGGRRRFCADQYADLDGNQEIEEEYAPMPKKKNGELDYGDLLRLHSSRQLKKYS